MPGLILLIGMGLAIAPLCMGQATLSVTPAYAAITQEAPHGTFTLRNEGTESIEIVVSARYGVIATEHDATDVVLGKGGRLGDLTDHLLFYPDRCILAPGDERVVRYMVDNTAAAADKAYITLMHFEMWERGTPSLEQVPVVASALNIVYSLVTPLVFINGTSRPALEARLVRLEPGALVLELAVQNEWPFLGGVTVSNDGKPMHRVETVVYTQRQIVIPLKSEELPSAITLQFDLNYTGMPASVQRNMVVPPSLRLEL